MKSIIDIMSDFENLAKIAINKIKYGEIVDRVEFDLRCGLNENLIPTSGAIIAYYVIKETGQRVHLWTMYCHAPSLRRLPNIAQLVCTMNQVMDVAYGYYYDWITDRAQEQ